MLRRTLRRAIWVCPVLLTAGCGAGEPPPPARPKAPPVAQAEPSPPSFTSPAKWSFHPYVPWSPTAAVALSDGACLFTTEEGLRIRTTEAKRGASGAVKCTGQTAAAADIAPESLVGIVERPGAPWLFVGESGTLYETEGPLDPLRRFIGAPTTFMRVAGGGKTVLAVSISGELFRLEENATWHPLAIPAARLFDVSVAADGRALALALPEKIFTSDDGMKFVEAPSVGTVGARRAGRTAAGMLGVQGITGAIVWTPNDSSPLAKKSEPTITGSVELEVKTPILPTATSVVDGRAALDGTHYVETVLLDGEDEEWKLASGTFDAPLSTIPLPDTRNCAGMRVGARGRHVTTACIKADEDSNYVAVVRMSNDGGAHFSEEVRFTAGDGELVGVAVTNDGSTLLTGVCRPRAGGSGCAGSPPLLLRKVQGVVAAMLAATPPLMGLPISPAFSVDGGSAYFLARRAKDERLALYVSHDGGRTFTERSLDVRAAGVTNAVEDEAEAVEGDRSDESLDPSDLTTLQPSDDGTLGMVLTTSRGLTYLTTDDDGRLLGVSRAPAEKAIMGGYGRRVIAISLSAEQATTVEQDVLAFESADGGASWNELLVTRALRREIVAGPMTVACGRAGCLVGTTITRVGWEGQADAPSVDQPRPRALDTVPAIGTPLVCTLDPKESWKRIEHVTSSLGFVPIYDIARGRALWSVLSFDLQTRAISTTFAQLPERGDGPARVTTKSLFGAAPSGAKFAIDLANQVEGYAAVRMRLPEKESVSGPMRNIEVAWENFVDGTSGRTSIPDAGELAEGDVLEWERGVALNMALMSVTSGAIFVRPHVKESPDKRLFLLDAKGKRTTFAQADWDTFFKFGKTNARADTALVEGKPLLVGTIDELDGEPNGPLTMLLAKPTDAGAWDVTATSLFPTDSKDRERMVMHDWSYRGGTEVGVVAISSEPKANRAEAAFFPFRADGTFGAPTELPTPEDLPAIPRPCKADDRRTTPRVGAHAFSDFSRPMYPGRRHPVLVTEVQKDKLTAGEPQVLLTSGIVLHGTKQSPCVAAFEAVAVEQISAGAVIAGDPSQAWMFRRVQGDSSRPGTMVRPPGAPRDGTIIEHRPMTCRFDATAKVPDVAWNQPGTFRWVTK